MSEGAPGVERWEGIAGRRELLRGERRDGSVVEGKSEREVVVYELVNGERGEGRGGEEGASGEEEEGGCETLKARGVPDGLGVGGELGEMHEGVVKAKETKVGCQFRRTRLLEVRKHPLTREQHHPASH